MSDTKPRRIRTFHVRNGRWTESLRLTHERLEHNAVLPDGPIDAPALFGRHAPVAIEIGAGHGAAAGAFARARPDIDLIALEVYKPGIAHMLGDIDEHSLPNLRVFDADAVEVLDDRLDPASLDRVHLFFPDPWPKRKQQRRRFVRPDLLDLLADRLRPGGVFLTATDDPDYARQMERVLGEHPEFDGGGAPRPDWRPLSGYEAKAVTAGRTINDFAVTRR